MRTKEQKSIQCKRNGSMDGKKIIDAFIKKGWKLFMREMRFNYESRFKNSNQEEYIRLWRY